MMFLWTSGLNWVDVCVGCFCECRLWDRDDAIDSCWKYRLLWMREGDGVGVIDLSCKYGDWWAQRERAEES